MKKHLTKALEELKEAGAEDIPEAHEILEADDGTEWNGTLENGDWKLIKSHGDNYTTNIQTNI